MAIRNLVLIFGDQLSHRISSLDGFASQHDRVAMAELHSEATNVWCHKSRLVFFFSAMRHFRDELLERGFPVEYHALTADPQQDQASDFPGIIRAYAERHAPKRLIATEPGDWQVRQLLIEACQSIKLPLELRPDRHFYCQAEEFSEWSADRKSLVLEYFYRWMRKQHGVLLDERGKPIGGEWNYDKENRRSFGKSGPPAIPPLKSFTPDKLTREVIKLVEKRFADHPGSTEHFSYPVDAAGAEEALQDFVQHRLSSFGDFQDAMWTETTFLSHSRLSAVMNAHLLDPQKAIAASIEAFQQGSAPINSVEGFVRQILGWREFVRGLYWMHMPGYAQLNELACDDRGVPSAYWNGKTEMNCIGQSMQTLVDHAYAHHIQRLMVLGLYAQLLGVHPYRFHEWHMAMYADAVDWVSLPNTLGMSQFGDGGIVGTKPYCASGNYIHRMSNYCSGCRYKPQVAVGDEACPITTMYWDFLSRHETKFANNGRMLFQIKNLSNKPNAERKQIRKRAEQIVAESQVGVQ
jgi:deoxyribodipyrimidine photolyase-related protein